jgi:hypothetical protein
MYVLAHASLIGMYDGRALLEQTLGRVLDWYRHIGLDGRWVFSVYDDGKIADPRCDSYTLAFLLMALAWVYRVRSDAQLLALIDEVYAVLDGPLAASGGGVLDGLPRPDEYRRQNPNMQLMEAYLALHEATGRRHDLDRAVAIGELFTSKLFDRTHEALSELHDDDWYTANPKSAWFEPGHHFEWVWLLRRLARSAPVSVDSDAKALFSRAATEGVDAEGFAIDRVDMASGRRTATRRCWSTCEYVKACAVETELPRPLAGKLGYQDHGGTNMSSAKQLPGGGRIDRTDRAVRSRRTAILLLLVGSVAYSWLIGTYLSPYAAGADPSGYLSFARLLTQGQVLAPVRALPGHTVTAFGEGTYQPQGFVIRDDSGFMAPTYSVGLPLHLALATWLVGLKYAVGLVNVLAALVAGALTYASCRHLKLGSAWAVGATLTLCLSPFFLNSALQPMSDLLATTWALATLYAAMRSRERIFWAIMCGAAFGIAVLIRPTNVLLAFPILVALGFNVRRLAGAALGALPSALFLLYLNFRLYGSPLTTGYGSPIQILEVVHADTTQPYSIAYVRHHLTSFTYWIMLYMGPLAICALAMPFFRRGYTRDWVMQAVWIAALTGFYAFYQPSGESWAYVRFLLPCLPQLVMLATGGLSGIWLHLEGTYRTPVKQLAPFHRLRYRSGLFKGLAICAMVTLSIVWTAAATHHLSVLHLPEGHKIFPDSAQWIIEHLPANALIWSSGMSGAIYYYTPFRIVRFDFIDKDKVPSFYAAAGTAKLPMYAVLRRYEGEVEQLTSRVGGSWKKVAELAEQQVTILEFVK